MKGKFTIYSNYDVYSHENMEAAREYLTDDVFYNADDNNMVEVKDNYGKKVKLTYEEYYNSIPSDRVMQECEEQDIICFDDVKSVFAKYSNMTNGIIAIADIGRWNGRCSGYKDVPSLKDIVYSNCDCEELYIDCYMNLHKKETNHDGSNYILYRQWKDNLSDQQKENFRMKIYKGTLTNQDITRYTKNIGSVLAHEYGIDR